MARDTCGRVSYRQGETIDRRLTFGRAAPTALIAVLALLVTGAAVAKDRKPVQPEADPSTVLVKFARGVDAVAAVHARGDALVARTATGVQLVGLAHGKSVEQGLAGYAGKPGVVYAEPNFVRRVDLPAPDDPSYSWGLPNIGAFDGWSIYPGSYSPPVGPRIAVVDTGIDSTHPDLSAHVVSAAGANCVSATDVCTPWVGGSFDDHGHGTHVAGIAGALANNGTGVAGVSFGSPLVPVKVCSGSGSCTIAAVTNGITWAVQHGARVINLSLGGYGFSQTECDAVAGAISGGAVVVAAAGNDGTTEPSYPASCPGAIGVAATDQGYGSPDWSNWGAPNVFVSAPGVDVMSTLPGAAYGERTGTSMATPFVSGLAALLLGQVGTRSPADVRLLIAETAQKVDFGYGGFSYGPDPYSLCSSCTWHPFYGYGLVDVHQALLGPPPIVTSFAPLVGTTGDTVVIHGAHLDDTTSVTFTGGLGGDFTVASSEEVDVTVPAGAHSGPLTVTTPRGSVTTHDFFAYRAVVSSFSPTSGFVGDAVVLHGHGFTDARDVWFGHPPGGLPPPPPFTIDSDSQITTVVPQAGFTGPIYVVIEAGPGSTRVAYPSDATFTVKPTLTSFAPAAAHVGAPVSITGTGFGGGVQKVEFGGVAATSAQATSPTRIDAVVPPGALSGPISVTTAGGTVASSSSFTVTIDPPKLSSFSPLSAPVGALVTIGGSNLSAVTEVDFGGVSGSFTIVSPTQIRATVPAAARTGTIQLTNAGGTATSLATFKVLPRLTSFSPSAGPAGSSVTIAGSGFTDVSAVKFNGVAAASPSVDSDHQITAAVPATALSGKVTVVTAGGTATSLASFKAVPTITGLSAGSAPPGSPVVVSGTGFGGVSSVKVNGVGAAFTTLSPTSLRLTVPASATSGAVSITTAGGVATSAATLFVTPRVGSFTPASAAVGAKVTIFGNAFGGATSVLFNGVLASPATVTATTITVFVPAAASTGKLTVVTPAGSGQSVGTFKVLPKIASFSPLSGPAGTSVTIAGSGFTDVSAVKFNGVAATSMSVDSDHQITATVPATATSGRIGVVTAGGTALSLASFKAVPTITGLSVGSAAPGSPVVVSGTGFGGVSSVKVNGVGAAFTTLSPTSLRLTVPASATSGTVSVTTAGGVATSAATLFVTPRVGSFTPAAAPVGAKLTIFGNAFGGATSVLFNGVLASPATVTATTITVFVPANASTGKLTVVTSAGSGQSAGTFKVLPKISSFSPSTGPAGTSVTIAGSGFTDVSAVKFNGVAAVSPSVDSDHQITATLPDAATSGKVSVVTAGGTALSLASFKAVPTIGGFAPGSAAPGSPVVVSGTGFGGVTSVKVNGVGAAFTTLSPTSLKLTVPASATSGTIAITTAGGVATSAGTLAVTPRVGSFTPASAPVGAKLTIFGNAFGGATSVLFNGVLASPATVTATTITVFVPANASTGKLTVVTPAGSGQSAGTFKVLPKIASFSPSTGPAGTSVTIAGSGFTDVSAVKFNGVAAVSPSVDSDHQITATVPATATTGRISVVTAGGSALSATGFTVTH